MRRKKVAKPMKAKKAIRNKAKKAVTLSLAGKMEAAFRGMATQIVAQYRQEISMIKAQEKKLAEALKKAANLTKAIKNKCITLEKAKPTPSKKKQLAAAKKGYTKANDAMTAMIAKVDQIKKQILSLTEKQNKWIALNKETKNFEKTWSEKAATQVKTMKKTPKKVVKKAKKATQKAAPIQKPQEIAETELTDEIETYNPNSVETIS